MARTVVAVVVALFFLTMPIWGERWQRYVQERRLRRHNCPTECQESMRCKCGCGGLLNIGGWRQEKCAVCGTPIVHDDEEFQGPYSSGHVNVSEITQETPAPKGFTSWGWERDREFRRARYARETWEGKKSDDGK